MKVNNLRPDLDMKEKSETAYVMGMEPFEILKDKQSTKVGFRTGDKYEGAFADGAFRGAGRFTSA